MARYMLTLSADETRLLLRALDWQILQAASDVVADTPDMEATRALEARLEAYLREVGA